MNSPLGQYAAPAAAVASLAIIGAYLVALIFSGPLGMDATSLGSLQSIAFLAAGALFGSSVAVNGYKAPLNSAHRRLDALQAAVTTTAATNPDTAKAVSAIFDASQAQAPAE